MASLKIPERYRQGVILLGNLSDGAFGELLSALQRAPEHMTTIRELTAWVDPETGSTSKPDISRIVDALTSLHRLQKRTKFPVSKIAHDVADDVQEFDSTSRARLQKRLDEALPHEALNVAAAKARELQTDREGTFCEAKILTDIRPVFGDAISGPPDGAIIIHTLKLGFHDSSSGSHKDVYVALDARDISDLKKTLNRAEDKEKSLKSVLSAAQLKQIEL